MIERAKHFDAFEFYYSLGDTRNITEVARKFTVSRASVSKWSRSFNWRNRVIQRDIEIGRSVSDKTNEFIINTKADYGKEIEVNLKILKTAINSAFEIITNEDGKKVAKLRIETHSINDLINLINTSERLIRLKLDLIGEPLPNKFIVEGLDEFVQAIQSDKGLKEKLLGALEVTIKKGES